MRFTDGTVDVRTLWLSDSAIRIGIARGSGGEGAEGSSPTLPPCGQLTRCFSAVAELLVQHVVVSVYLWYCIITIQTRITKSSLSDSVLLDDIRPIILKGMH